jgi:transcriptional regulator with XRE-family HTH domain
MENSVGKVISARLKQLEKKQAWLAEKTQVSINAVSKWIRTGKISRENIPLVAQALGISTDQLLKPTAIATADGPAFTTKLDRLDFDEAELIDIYRGATDDQKKMIIAAARIATKPASAPRRDNDEPRNILRHARE